MNYINYIKHVITTPETYHRDYEKDLPEEDSITKRALLALIPFVSLYRPAGTFISTGMGGYRVFNHFSTALNSGSLSDLIPTAFAIAALASSIFQFSLGLFVTTAIDSAQGGITLLTHMYEGKWDLAGEDALQTAANTLYLVFMATGTLEFMLWFVAAQMILSLVQARGEIGKERYIEAGAKILMGVVRLAQVDDYRKLIERRDAVTALAKYKSLIERANRAREVRQLIENPLHDALQKEDGELGSHFHGFGKQLVKGENLTIRHKTIDGNEMIELDFKVNHVFRDQLQKVVDETKSFQSKEVREILHFTGSHATNITIQSGEFFHLGEHLAGTHKINFVGLGTVMIGSNRESPNLYDRVVIHLPTNATLYDFHEMVAFMNLDDALNLSTFEDIERLKLGHLYRTFFPKEALLLERSAEFFSLSIDALREKMFEKTPAMREVYTTYFHRMVQEEIFPGKVRYRIAGLSEKAYELGARALTAAILGAYQDDELFGRVATILKTGMLSTETRYENDIHAHGLGGSGIDFYFGGADSIYTQMLTENNAKRQMSFSNLAYHSKVRLLIKLDALEMGSYQYLTDSFGTRLMSSSPWGWEQDSYKNRSDIFTFTKTLQNSSYSHSGHEVMLKERLAPSFIQALIVPDQATYNNLSRHLRDQGITIADNFIRIATKVTPELFS